MTVRGRRWSALAWWAVVAGWMLAIFCLSAQPGTQSETLSDAVARVVERLSAGLLAEVDYATVQLVVRKCAHFAAYLILGALLALALGAPPAETAPLARGRARRRRSWFPHRIARGHLAALVVAAAYAVSDEFHQTFVPGRVGAPTDVLIDTAGATVGILLVAWLARRSRRATRHRVARAR